MSLRINPISKSYKIKVGITIGDPSGIGPAVTLKALDKLKRQIDVVVIGDKWVLSKLSPLGCNLSDNNLVDLANVSKSKFAFGKVSAGYGKASVEYLEVALRMLRTKEIDCLVTAPISKEAINKAGFNYSGHTEFLAQRTHTKETVMMLLNKRLKFSLVTRHSALKDVAKQLSADKLSSTILLTHQALKKLFGIKNPRVVVCGLNPHASDNGIIGNEEINIIKPVVNKLRIKNLSGPFSADVAIARANNQEYDCVIAMYHDQALIPLKLTEKFSGVNITLGLPFVRTSPLHGTAFDIANKPALADPRSMIEAIKLAVQCTLNLKKD
jgi:4-hydroxythreonine-4-phosphate dehydrogenase